MAKTSFFNIFEERTFFEAKTSSVKSQTPYYAFGMEMPGRSVGSDYKYGMNGQMKEGETFEGAYSADYWTYDSRLGRRWEVDPLAYFNQSPYVTFNNNPVYFADFLGLEGDPPKKGDEYKCEDGSKEYFDGTQYKPKVKGNNYLIINESQSSGKWDLDLMNKYNTNFKVIYTKDIKKAYLEIKLNNLRTSKPTSSILFFSHGYFNQFSFGGGGSFGQASMTAPSVLVYMKKGRGNVGDSRVDDFLETMQDLASTFDNGGGLFIFLPCLVGESKNGSELQKNESLPIALTDLITQENGNIVTMFHNDLTLFKNNQAWMNKNKMLYIDFGKPMTSLKDRKMAGLY